MWKIMVAALLAGAYVCSMAYLNFLLCDRGLELNERIDNLYLLIGLWEILVILLPSIAIGAMIAVLPEAHPLRTGLIVALPAGALYVCMMCSSPADISVGSGIGALIFGSATVMIFLSPAACAWLLRRLISSRRKRLELEDRP